MDTLFTLSSGSEHLSGEHRLMSFQRESGPLRNAIRGVARVVGGANRRERRNGTDDAKAPVEQERVQGEKDEKKEKTETAAEKRKKIQDKAKKFTEKLEKVVGSIDQSGSIKINEDYQKVTKALLDLTTIGTDATAALDAAEKQTAELETRVTDLITKLKSEHQKEKDAPREKAFNEGREQALIAFDQRVFAALKGNDWQFLDVGEGAPGDKGSPTMYRKVELSGKNGTPNEVYVVSYNPAEINTNVAVPYAAERGIYIYSTTAKKQGGVDRNIGDNIVLQIGTEYKKEYDSKIAEAQAYGTLQTTSDKNDKNRVVGNFLRGGTLNDFNPKAKMWEGHEKCRDMIIAKLDKVSPAQKPVVEESKKGEKTDSSKENTETDLGKRLAKVVKSLEKLQDQYSKMENKTKDQQRLSEFITSHLNVLRLSTVEEIQLDKRKGWGSKVVFHDSEQLVADPDNYLKKLRSNSAANKPLESKVSPEIGKNFEQTLMKEFPNTTLHPAGETDRYVLSHADPAVIEKVLKYATEHGMNPRGGGTDVTVTVTKFDKRLGFMGPGFVEVDKDTIQRYIRSVVIRDAGNSLWNSNHMTAELNKELPDMTQDAFDSIKDFKHSSKQGEISFDGTKFVFRPKANKSAEQSAPDTVDTSSSETLKNALRDAIRDLKSKVQNGEDLQYQLAFMNETMLPQLARANTMPKAGWSSNVIETKTGAKVIRFDGEKYSVADAPRAMPDKPTTSATSTPDKPTAEKPVQTPENVQEKMKGPNVVRTFDGFDLDLNDTNSVTEHLRHRFMQTYSKEHPTDKDQAYSNTTVGFAGKTYRDEYGKTHNVYRITGNESVDATRTMERLLDKAKKHGLVNPKFNVDDAINGAHQLEITVVGYEKGFGYTGPWPRNSGGQIKNVPRAEPAPLPKEPSKPVEAPAAKPDVKAPVKADTPKLDVTTGMNKIGEAIAVGASKIAKGLQQSPKGMPNQRSTDIQKPIDKPAEPKSPEKEKDADLKDALRAVEFHLVAGHGEGPELDGALKILNSKLEARAPQNRAQALESIGLTKEAVNPTSGLREFSLTPKIVKDANSDTEYRIASDINFSSVGVTVVEVKKKSSTLKKTIAKGAQNVGDAIAKGAGKAAEFLGKLNESVPQTPSKEKDGTKNPESKPSPSSTTEKEKAKEPSLDDILSSLKKNGWKRINGSVRTLQKNDRMIRYNPKIEKWEERSIQIQPRINAGTIPQPINNDVRIESWNTLKLTGRELGGDVGTPEVPRKTNTTKTKPNANPTTTPKANQPKESPSVPKSPKTDVPPTPQLKRERKEASESVRLLNQHLGQVKSGLNALHAAVQDQDIKHPEINVALSKLNEGAKQVLRYAGDPVVAEKELSKVFDAAKNKHSILSNDGQYYKLTFDGKTFGVEADPKKAEEVRKETVSKQQKSELRQEGWTSDDDVVFMDKKQTATIRFDKKLGWQFWSKKTREWQVPSRVLNGPGATLSQGATTKALTPGEEQALILRDMNSMYQFGIPYKNPDAVPRREATARVETAPEKLPYGPEPAPPTTATNKKNKPASKPKERNEILFDDIESGVRKVQSSVEKNGSGFRHGVNNNETQAALKELNSSVTKAMQFGALPDGLVTKIKELDLSPRNVQKDYRDEGKMYDLKFDGMKFILEKK